MPNCNSRLIPVYADSPCHDCKIKISSGRCRNWCNGFADYQELLVLRKQKEKDSGISPTLAYSNVKSFF